MERSEHHYSDRAILLFGLGLALVLGLAWLTEAFFFSIYQFQIYDILNLFQDYTHISRMYIVFQDQR